MGAPRGAFYGQGPMRYNHGYVPSPPRGRADMNVGHYRRPSSYGMHSTQPPPPLGPECFPLESSSSAAASTITTTAAHDDASSKKLSSDGENHEDHGSSSATEISSAPTEPPESFCADDALSLSALDVSTAPPTPSTSSGGQTEVTYASTVADLPIAPSINRPCEFDDQINVVLSQEELAILYMRFHTVNVPGKTSIQIINELFPGSNKVVVKLRANYGSAHAPVFACEIHFEGIGMFVGLAASKQDSKQAAAKKVCDYLAVMPKPSVAVPLSQTSGRYSNKKSRTNLQGVADGSSQANSELADESSISASLKRLRSVSNHNREPGADGEGGDDRAQTDAALEEVEATPSNDKPYLMDLETANIVYEAARAKCMEVISPDTLNQLIIKSNKSDAQIASLLRKDYWRYKEMAAFVLLSELDKGCVQVLSLGTGTKCVSSEHMSLDGNVLNDCHAEVIARRGLMVVLWEQLKALVENGLQGKFVEPLVWRPQGAEKGSAKLSKTFTHSLPIPFLDRQSEILARTSGEWQGLSPEATSQAPFVHYLTTVRRL